MTLILGCDNSIGGATGEGWQACEILQEISEAISWDDAYYVVERDWPGWSSSRSILVQKVGY